MHYQSYGTPGGEFQPACRAAIITIVYDDTTIGLVVLNPTGMFFHEECEYHGGDIGVDHTGHDLPPSYDAGTWHWPERVD